MSATQPTTLTKQIKPAKKKSVFTSVSLILIGVFGLIVALNYFRHHSTSGLQVTTPEHQTVDVYLDGQLIGSTPFYHDRLSPGEYLLTLKPHAQDLLSFDRKIKLNADYLTVVDWHPATSADKAWGFFYEPGQLDDFSYQNQLTIESTPDNVFFKIDDQDQDSLTPQTLHNLSSDIHRLLFSLPSHERIETKINLTEKIKLNLYVKLAALDQNLIQDSDSLSAQTSAFDEDAGQNYSNRITAPLGSSLIVTSTGSYQNRQESLVLRSSPDANSQPVVTVDVGTRLTYLGDSTDDFIKVQINQNIAWADRRYVKFN